MTELILNGTSINSLQDLREQFSLPQVMSCFLDGTLERWLDDCYYDHLSDAVYGLERESTAQVEKDLCIILGVDYSLHAKTTANEDNIAANQAELATILNKGARTIYLAKNRFCVPIKIGDIHYIGLEGASLEAPYTEEEYRKAGITFTDIRFPDAAEEVPESIDEDFSYKERDNSGSTSLSALTAHIHAQLKGYRPAIPCHIHYDADISAEFYKSRIAAETAGKQVISKAYDQANEFFSPGSKTCIALPLARKYAEILQETCSDIPMMLEAWAIQNKGYVAKLNKLSTLVKSVEQALTKEFEQELQDNAFYYRMYEKRYFLGALRISKFDNGIDLFESSILNGLAHIIDTEYGIENLFEVIMELQEDVNKHADEFFSSAQELFREYCKKVEKIAEEIGCNLSSDMFKELGIIDKTPESPIEAAASRPEASAVQ